MTAIIFLWKNIKWRFHNAFTIAITILQPMLWLVLYSAVAEQSMNKLGISNYAAFIMPGLIVLLSCSCCSSGGIMNYLMKRNGSFYRVLIAPVSRCSILIGQLLESVLCTFLEISILFIVGSTFFSVKIASGFIGISFIVLLVFLTAFFIAGIAYAISLTLPNEVVYETVMNAFVLPFFFLSTALFPEQTLTGTLHTVVKLNPFTHSINVLRALILQGSVALPALLHTIFLFLVLCSISFFWAYSCLKKQTQS